jgi:hypothetical protein
LTETNFVILRWEDHAIIEPIRQSGTKIKNSLVPGASKIKFVLILM